MNEKKNINLIKNRVKNVYNRIIYIWAIYIYKGIIGNKENDDVIFLFYFISGAWEFLQNKLLILFKSI